MGFFDKIKQGLTKTKTKMDAQLTGIFAAYEPGDEEFFEDLEETLILADTGVETTTKAIAQLRKAIELKKLTTGAEVKKEFVQILTRILKVQDTMLLLTTQPSVVLVVGVNGVGKTTTCGMIIDYLCRQKKGPILVVDADANSNLNEVLGAGSDNAASASSTARKSDRITKGCPFTSTVTGRSQALISAGRGQGRPVYRGIFPTAAPCGRCWRPRLCR